MTSVALSNLTKQLQTFFKGDIFNDSQTLEENSRDASIFQMQPTLVVHPKDTQDICALVNFVREQKRQDIDLSLTARSAGTDMTGGPLSTSIVVSFTKYFHTIQKVGANFAITQPGAYYRDFEKATLEKGLLLPSFPASRDLCTVGGMTANNSGGEKTLTYGKTEQYVQRIKMVIHDGSECVFEPLTLEQLKEKQAQTNAEGEIYRRIFTLIDTHYDGIIAAKPPVSKNSAGYYLWNVYDRVRGTFDLTKLLVGSQGTLGLITEIKFKLVKPKAFSRLLVIMLKDFQDVSEVTNRVLVYKPESFESYDQHTFKVALRFLPDLAKRLKTGLFKMAFAFLPEFWMILTGGVPELVLIAQFTADTPEEAERAALDAQASLKTFHFKTKVTKSEKEEEKYWVVRRESFNLLRQHMHKLRTAPFIDDFIVRPEFLPKFLPKLYKILNATKLLFTVAGHVGDGNFHIIPLMDMSRPNASKVIQSLSEKVYDLVLSYHGSITGEHNDGLIRTPYLKKMYGENICALFEETKHIFDPDGIFNPGKKVGTSLKEAFTYLDTKM